MAETTPDETKPAADTAVAKKKLAAMAKPKKVARRRRRPAKRAAGKASSRVPKASSPKRRKRTFSTATQRAKILATAQKEGLTAPEVQKRFGVKPVTYYSWRKKSGLKGPRGRRPINPSRGGAGDLTAQVRAGVQERVRVLLPAVVHEEVNRYLAVALGSGTRRGRRRA